MNLLRTIWTLVKVNVKSSPVQLQSQPTIERFFTQITFHRIQIQAQFRMAFQVAGSLVVVSTFFTLESSLPSVFCHVNQAVSFLPESSFANIAPKVISVDSLVMKENLLLVHFEDVLAFATPPVMASHVLFKVFAGTK